MAVYIKYIFIPLNNDWCNKGRGMCSSVCGMVHIKETYGGSGFPFSLSEW